MKTENPTEKLRLLSRAAVVNAKGDMDSAFERLDKSITQEESAGLERELCHQWRATAIRALLATAFQELRSEGKIRQPSSANLPTIDYDRVRERVKPKSWAHQHVEKMEQRARNYLDTFMIDGEPIGDCTAEKVLQRADRHEADTRFMRLMASGVPPQGIIRDYVSEDEAATRYEMSRTTASSAVPWPPALLSAFDLMMKGIKNDDQHRVALARVEQLMDAKADTFEGHELDCLARAIKEYEDKQ